MRSNMQIINGLAVYDEGNKDNRPIIFVHGFPYDHTMWDSQFEFFKKKFRVISYDIRGLGKSETGDGQYTMESYVDDLFKIIEELNLDKPILCGLSMGGYISFRAIERQQNLFGGLILCDTKPQADDDAGKLKRAAGIKLINGDGVIKFVDGFVPNTFAEESKSLEIYRITLDKCRMQNPIGVKGALIAMLSRTDTSEAIKNFNLPVLSICGEKDALTPPDVMREFTNKIPNAKFAEIPKAGHMTPLEAPDLFNKILGEFLDNLN